jgi:Uma2 family endonuclease
MSILVTDRELASKLRAEREKTDAARYDEIWDGVYVIGPPRDIEHQVLLMDLWNVVDSVVSDNPSGWAIPGMAVSDRDEGWPENVRQPDVSVVLEGNPGKDCRTHWCGGPDFLVEILSDNDLARDKRPFYAKLGVRELLIVDRDPWGLELYRLEEGDLALAGRSTLDEPVMLASAVLPLVFRLVPGPTRPQIEVQRVDGSQTWTI